MPSYAGNAIAVHDGTSMRSIAESAFRFRRIWCTVALGIIVLTGVYVLVCPRAYQSEMDILVQNRRGDEQITPNRNTGVVTMSGVTEEQINSEIELLRSRNLANVVVDPLWDKRDVTKMSQQDLKNHDKAVDQFLKHLTAEMIRKSNVIHVSYSATDPKTATDTLNRLLAAFLVKQKELAQPPGTAQFFADQAAGYKQQLDAAQQELAQYQQQHDIVSLPDTEQNMDRQINDAETDLRATDAQMSELNRRIGVENSQLKTVPIRQATIERTIPNDYSVERLNTMLAELENRRTELLTKFTPQDRLVQEIEKQIADTRQALTNAQGMHSREQSTDINPAWQAVSNTIIQDEASRQAAKAKHDALTAQIATMRQNLSGTESSTVPFTTLKQKVTDLENNYQLYTQKHDEAMIADAMNENRLLNVAVEQSPTFTVTPYRPKPLMDLALGGFTALFLASFVVFFAEVGRTTIADAGEIERISMLPVLATVPVDPALLAQPTETAPMFIGLSAQRLEPEQPGLSAALMRFGKGPRAI